MKTKLTDKTLQHLLHTHTATLATNDGRRVGQPGHQRAREYLAGQLHEITGLLPFHGDSFELHYTGTLKDRQALAAGATKWKFTGHQFTNLVGVIPGLDRSLPPLLLGAHYDSVIDAPCADDNATSVALNLAIAKLIQPGDLERDLIIALFDAEEPPYFQTQDMGSTRFYEEYCKGMKFAGVIVTDLIGHDFDVQPLIGDELPWWARPLPINEIVFLTGAESDGILPGIVESVAAKSSGLRIVPTLNRYIGNLSDHHAFEQNGHPFLFLSCAQGRHYHAPEDTLEWINFKKLTKLTRFIESLLIRMDETPAGNAPYATDPVEFEARMWRKAVGPVGEYALKRFGLELPTSRHGFDRTIESLVGTLV